jgi:hypothetical protein
MRDMCIGNEKGRLRSKVLLGALALKDKKIRR